MSTNFNNLTVMIIDDHSTMRNIIRQLLNKVDIKKIKEANNGLDAISKLQDYKTEDYELDLIICDLHMDKMDGLEFVRKIRSGSVTIDRNIPIIILTGSTDKLLEEVAIQVGANRVLTKPISSEKLGEEIEAIVGISKDIPKAAPSTSFDNKQTVTHKAGDTIFKQGDDGATAYVIMSGRVELSSLVGGKNVPFGIVEQGSIFGEMALFDNKTRVVTATALDDIECSIVDSDYMHKQIKSSPFLVQTLLRIMVKTIKRLRDRV